MLPRRPASTLVQKPYSPMLTTTRSTLAALPSNSLKTGINVGQAPGFDRQLGYFVRPGGQVAPDLVDIVGHPVHAVLRPYDPGAESPRGFLYGRYVEIVLYVDVGEILALVRIGERKPPGEYDEPNAFAEIEHAAVRTAPDREDSRDAGFFREGPDVEQFTRIKVVGPQLDHVHLVPEPVEGGEVLGYRGAGQAQAISWAWPFLEIRPVDVELPGWSHLESTRPRSRTGQASPGSTHSYEPSSASDGEPREDAARSVVEPSVKPRTGSAYGSAILTCQTLSMKRKRRNRFRNRRRHRPATPHRRVRRRQPMAGRSARWPRRGSARAAWRDLRGVRLPGRQRPHGGRLANEPRAAIRRTARARARFFSSMLLYRSRGPSCKPAACTEGLRKRELSIMVEAKETHVPSHSILPDARRAAIEAAFDEALAEVRAAGDVALLQECRAIFRGRVPLHLRAYVAAALALRGAGRQPDHRRQGPEASREKRKDGRPGKPAPVQPSRYRQKAGKEPAFVRRTRRVYWTRRPGRDASGWTPERALLERDEPRRKPSTVAKESRCSSVPAGGNAFTHALP
ncbi:MAG: hypothetical protein MZV63_46700 [Marinilabiliales bacterium]|nr:hypothetical protein [Marinilabiliales bacterium]